MKRRAFNLAAVTSLLLCVATALLWVRSHRLIEGLIWRFSHEASIGIATGPGRFYVGYSTEAALPARSRLEYVNIPVQYPLSEPAPAIFEFAGFGIYNSAMMKTARIPCWFVLAGSICTGVFWWRLAHVPGAGCCARCGYDLRATPDRCPECGAVPAAK